MVTRIYESSYRRGGRRTAARRLALRRGGNAITPSRHRVRMAPFQRSRVHLPWGVECDELSDERGGAATKLTVWCGASAVGVTQTATKLTDVTETELTELTAVGILDSVTQLFSSEF